MRQTRLFIWILGAVLATSALQGAEWPRVSLEEAKGLHGQSGVLFVDGRSRSDWEKSRIPDALSLPTGEFDKRYPQLKAKLRRAKTLVLYCQGIQCAQADYLAGLLALKGHRTMRVFSGGFPAWTSAKLPVQKSKKNK